MDSKPDLKATLKKQPRHFQKLLKFRFKTRAKYYFQNSSSKPSFKTYSKSILCLLNSKLIQNLRPCCTLSPSKKWHVLGHLRSRRRTFLFVLDPGSFQITAKSGTLLRQQGNRNEIADALSRPACLVLQRPSGTWPTHFSCSIRGRLEPKQQMGRSRGNWGIGDAFSRPACLVFWRPPGKSPTHFPCSIRAYLEPKQKMGRSWGNREISDALSRPACLVF